MGAPSILGSPAGSLPAPQEMSSCLGPWPMWQVPDAQAGHRAQRSRGPTRPPQPLCWVEGVRLVGGVQPQPQLQGPGLRAAQGEPQRTGVGF